MSGHYWMERRIRPFNLLQKAYDYFGAHNGADRVHHERDRGIQRMLAPLLTLVLFWSAKEASFLPEPIPTPFIALFCAYSAAAAIYLLALRWKPDGLVTPQYLFIVFDPLFPILAIVVAPSLFGWLVVLLSAIPARCGIRYGLRTFWLKWCCAALWFALVLALLPSARITPVALSLGMALLLSIPLFVPLIRIARRSHELDIRQARLDVMTESVTAKSIFLAKVSHEMRSPLQTILSTVDTFELRNQSPSGMDLARKIRRALSSLNRHLVDLLTLASSEAGNLTMHPEVVDIGELFADVSEEFRELATNKHLQLHLEVPEEPIFVEIDPIRLSQIIENLVTNAIRYTQSGAVTIRLRPWNAVSRAIEFEVEDTGPGIDANQQALIFAPYARASESAHLQNSIGMGLAVVRTLVSHMNGKVTLQSAPGKGSKFIVTVAAIAKRHAESHRRIRILVVDDQEDVLSSLQSLIQGLGFDADVASDARAAESLLALNDYAAVLCDLQMPLKTGVELARSARSDGTRNRTAKWIAMTADIDSTAGQSWPFDALVVKPVRALALKQLLEA